MLAGGQSLMPLLAMRLARPSQLVDINDVDELSRHPDDGDGVAFGAITRERDAERSPLVAERAAGARRGAAVHRPRRRSATAARSAAASPTPTPSPSCPRSPWSPAPRWCVRSARGERVVPADDFFVGHFTTTLDDDELLVEVRMPSGPAGAGWAFHEIVRRHGDFALVGVAAMVALDGDGASARRASCLIGVADRAGAGAAAEASLVGQAADADAFAAAAEDAVRDLDPASDIHGSAEFRRHLAGVTVRRALTTAAERAGGASMSDEIEIVVNGERRRARRRSAR